MVKVINKKGKKLVNIDGREYGPKSPYFHIQRTTSSLEYFTKKGDWDEKRQNEVKKYIQNQHLLLNMVGQQSQFLHLLRRGIQARNMYIPFASFMMAMVGQDMLTLKIRETLMASPVLTILARKSRKLSCSTRA